MSAIRFFKALMPVLIAAACGGCSHGGPSIVPSADREALSSYAALMVFRGGRCVELLREVKASDLPPVSLVPSDNVAIVAYDDPERLFFSELEPGKEENAYYVGSNAPGLGLPRIWAGAAAADGDTVASPELKKITAGVSLNIVSPPAGMVSASVPLPPCYDSYRPSDGAFLVCDPPVTVRVKDGASLNVFPASSDEGWNPSVSLSFKDNTFSVDIPVGWRISPGDDIRINLDFSGYQESALFSAVFTCGDFVYECRLPLIPDGADVDPSCPVQVQVRSEGGWKSATVRKALCSDASLHSRIWNDWDNSLGLRDTMYYCIFEDDTDGPLEVMVRNAGGKGFESVEVRPSPWNIEAVKVAPDAVRFTLPSGDRRKVSVEFDGDRQHNLFLFPAPPAEVPQGDVIYFGPGEHDAGRIDLRDGQTCFLDYGAVVYGSICVRGDGCTVAGHGVLSGTKLRHWGEQYSNGEIILNCNPERKRVLKNLTVKDITIVDGPSWNLVLYNIDGAVIDGVNIIDWELNGDGIDVASCRNVEIKNCFIRSYDDCITLKVRFNANPVSDLCDIHVHDNLIWNDYARGIVVGPETGNVDYGTGYAHDILIEDCIILQHKAGTKMDDLRAGFAIGQCASPDHSWGGGTSERVERVTARNLLFDNIDRTGRNVEIWQYRDMDGTCTMKDITLENFTILDGNKVQTPAFYATANQHSIKGLHIKNFVFGSKKITSAGDDFVLKGDIEADFQ